MTYLWRDIYNKFHFPYAVHVLACGNSFEKDDLGVAHNLLCVAFAVSDNAQEKGIQLLPSRD